MADSIPEYYRHLADKKGEKEPAGEPASRKPRNEGRAGAAEDEPAQRVYRADAFRLIVPAEGWTDGSVYTLTGPTTDGIQHNITVNVEHEPEADSLDEFAEQQVASLEPQLDDCHVLMEDRVELDSEEPAHRAIFVWYPKDDLRLYQEQLYVLHDGRGYTLTASFTRKTRKQFGPEVERMMLSFNPLDESRAP